MRDFSNRMIFILLLMALVITIAGTLINVNRLLDLERDYNLLSGAASTTIGEANLTISSTTSLTNQNATLDFGSGRVNASCAFCSMDSNGIVTNHYSNGSNISGTFSASGSAAGSCCVGFTSVASGFLIENTGNLNLSVGYICAGNCTHATYVGGTRYGGMAGISIKVIANSAVSQYGESGATDTVTSCAGGGTLYNNTGWNISNTSAYTGGAIAGAGVGGGVYVSLSPIGHWLCGNSSSYPLSYENTQDAAVVDINITIPNDAPGTGVKTSFRLTFNGTSS